MVSRYRGGDAVRRSPRRLGLQPSFSQQVVEAGSLLPRPASPRLASLVSRERIAPHSGSIDAKRPDLRTLSREARFPGWVKPGDGRDLRATWSELAHHDIERRPRWTSA